MESTSELGPESASGAGKRELSRGFLKGGGRGNPRAAASPTVGDAEAAGEVESAAAAAHRHRTAFCQAERALQDDTFGHE